MKLSWVCGFAMILGMVVAVGEEGVGGDFIRVKEEEGVAKLQTAVFGYEREGVRVDLVGAIHVADERYFEFLNEWFENYEVVLFEMVGGEHLGGGKRVDGVEELAEEEELTEEEDGDQDRLAGLGKLYGAMERALGLVGQVEVIDYFADNFVHADLTMAEFEALQEARGESLLGFMIQASLAAERPEREPSSVQLMRGLVTGRSDLVKLELMHSMAAGDGQIDAVGGENVIISDRNARCMEVLAGELVEGRRKMAVFYGAAHFPDMERRLLEMGFVRVSEKWLTAWRVAKGR